MKKKLLLAVGALSLVLSLGSCDLLFLAMLSGGASTPTYSMSNATQISTISSTNYIYRSNWNYGTLSVGGEVDWYYVNTNSYSTYYIHWQDSYEYDTDYTYSNPTCDVKVSVYTPSGTLIRGPQDYGYSSIYSASGSTDGFSVSGYTQYYIKVEGYSINSTGSYYLSVTN